jgi:hypothetical protein
LETSVEAVEQAGDEGWRRAAETAIRVNEGDVLASDAAHDLIEEGLHILRAHELLWTRHLDVDRSRSEGEVAVLPAGGFEEAAVLPLEPSREREAEDGDTAESEQRLERLRSG